MRESDRMMDYGYGISVIENMNELIRQQTFFARVHNEMTQSYPVFKLSNGIIFRHFELFVVYHVAMADFSDKYGDTNRYMSGFTKKIL